MSPPPDRMPARTPPPWRNGVAIGLVWGAALLFAYALPAQTGTPSGSSATAVAADGHALFLERCGICHLPGGTGTFMLGRRLGKQHALLADRTDLQIAYVEAIVRNGLNSMPALTRVEVTDRELDAVAKYLARRREDTPADRSP
jgi:mono/diheme cytochrome c family protein